MVDVGHSPLIFRGFIFALITFFLFTPKFTKKTSEVLVSLLTFSAFGSAFLTDIVLKKGNLCSVEGNPYMRSIICRYGVMGMWVSKTFILALFLVGIWEMYRYCDEKRVYEHKTSSGDYLFVNFVMFIFLWVVWTNILDLIVDIIVF